MGGYEIFAGFRKFDGNDGWLWVFVDVLMVIMGCCGWFECGGSGGYEIFLNCVELNLFI